MKPIKIAMMSLNHGHARGYYTALKDNPNFIWVAASVDQGDKNSVFLNMIEDIPLYESDIDMLNQHPEIEAVILASANYLHYSQIKMCAERGIHIYSMKVPTLNMDEYDDIQRLIKENNLVFQIELELRYNATTQRIKLLLKQNAIGKLLSVQAVNASHCPMWWLPWHGIPEQSYGSRVPLRKGDSRFRGGALTDHPHIFDIVTYLTGSEFKMVFAYAAPNIRSELDEEDMLSIVGKLKNDVIFSLDPSYSRHENHLPMIGPGWEQYPKRVEVNMVLNGEHGSILADFFPGNVYHTGLPGQRLVARYADLGNDRMMMLNEFSDCIRNSSVPTVNLDVHKKTMEAMNAVYDSIQRSSAVYL